jgi:hypothetical protein
MKTAAAATILGLAMTAAAGVAQASTEQGTERASAAVRFTIVIPAIVRAEGVTHPQRLEIRNEDIARGYVDLDDATTLSLTSNSRAGYNLSAAIDSNLLQRVEVRLQGRSLSFSAEATSQMVSTARLSAARVNVGYRLHLNPGVAAGHYRWPVALSFATGA